MATSPQRLIRSTYIVRIARSSLRYHSFLVEDDIKCITGLFFNAVCTLQFVIGLIGPTVRLIAGQVTLGLRTYGHRVFIAYDTMMIDDSTTKNTHLLDREFIPKTEHLNLNFWSSKCDSL